MLLHFSPQKELTQPTNNEDSSDTSSIILIQNSTEWSTNELTPNEKRLGYKIKKLRKRLSQKKAQSKHFRRRCSLLKRQAVPKDVIQKLLNGRPKYVCTFIKMQFSHKKRQKWLKREKELAMSIYYKSPSAYRHLLQQGFTLPAVSTIKKWMSVLNLKTGVNTKLVGLLEEKTKTMEDMEKECVVLFDEIKLEKGLDYNPYHDMLEGLVYL